MLISHHLRIVLVILFGFALLLTGMGGDHLHLCFDGQEPPIMLHAENSGLHPQGMEAGERHAYHDVDVAAAVPAKAKSTSLDGPLLLVLCVLLTLLPWLHTLPLSGASHAIKSAPFFLRPLLRGPPI